MSTCIVIGTYYTCKCQRNTKELSYCKNNKIKRLNQSTHIYFKNMIKKSNKKKTLNKKHMIDVFQILV